MRNKKTLFMTKIAVLVAVMLVMWLTGIGFIPFFGFSITIMAIPVAIGAIICGPKGGLILGFVWGFTALMTALGVPTLDALGGQLVQISLFRTILLCFIPRLLVGLLSALIYKGLRKVIKYEYVSNLIASVAAPIINTVFFMGLLVVLFYNTEPIQAYVEMSGKTNILAFILWFIGVNVIVEIAVNAVVASGVSKMLVTVFNKKQPVVEEIEEE